MSFATTPVAGGIEAGEVVKWYNCIVEDIDAAVGVLDGVTGIFWGCEFKGDIWVADNGDIVSHDCFGSGVATPIFNLTPAKSQTLNFKIGRASSRNRV